MLLLAFMLLSSEFVKVDWLMNSLLNSMNANNNMYNNLFSFGQQSNAFGIGMLFDFLL